MTARCPKCSRLLCDHHVPPRYEAPRVDERQLPLPLEVSHGAGERIRARAAVDGGANRRTPAAHRATVGPLAAEVATGGAARASFLEERRYG